MNQQVLNSEKLSLNPCNCKFVFLNCVSSFLHHTKTETTWGKSLKSMSTLFHEMDGTGHRRSMEKTLNCYRSNLNSKSWRSTGCKITSASWKSLKIMVVALERIYGPALRTKRLGNLMTFTQMDQLGLCHQI